MKRFGAGAVPVLLAGLEEDAVAGTDHLDRPAAPLAEADALRSRRSSGRSGAYATPSRAPGAKWTLLALSREPPAGAATESMKTAPVNQSAGPGRGLDRVSRQLHVCSFRWITTRRGTGAGGSRRSGGTARRDRRAGHVPRSGSGKRGRRSAGRPAGPATPSFRARARTEERHDQSRVRRVPHPAVGALLDDGLPGCTAHVHGEEAAQHRHRPLPKRDAGDHQHEPRDEDDPPSLRDRAVLSSRQRQCPGDSGEQGGDHDQDASPIDPLPRPVEAAADADAERQHP